MPLGTITSSEPSFPEIDGLPTVDLAVNLIHMQAAGRGIPSLLAELFSLMRGPGRMTPAEYFYYRLWDPALTREEKRGFVGRRAQVVMHQACNAGAFRKAADDKLRFHELMTAHGLPVPKLLAIVHRDRQVKSVRTLSDRDAVAHFLADPDAFPLCAKPVAGKYSLNVISADGLDVASSDVQLRGCLRFQGGDWRSAWQDMSRAICCSGGLRPTLPSQPPSEIASGRCVSWCC